MEAEVKEEFDPEKVDRFGVVGGMGQQAMPAQYVNASDYDQLLELYRKQAETIDALLAAKPEVGSANQ